MVWEWFFIVWLWVEVMSQSHWVANMMLIAKVSTCLFFYYLSMVYAKIWFIIINSYVNKKSIKSIYQSFLK